MFKVDKRNDSLAKRIVNKDSDLMVGLCRFKCSIPENGRKKCSRA